MGDFGLKGKESIKKYTGYGWKKIKRFMDNEKFPVWFDGDTYVSDKVLIDDWRRDRIKESVG